MKVNRSSNSNLRFLYGSVFFFAVLILTMVLFMYYAMGEASKNNGQQQMFSYTISFSGDFGDSGCGVVLDDSVLCAPGAPVPGGAIVVSRRTLRDTLAVDGKTTVQERVLFSPESVLRVVDAANGDTVTVAVGNNSRIEITRPDGRINVNLME
jgi:hypothetical protein